MRMKRGLFMLGLLIYSSVLAAQKVPKNGWHLKDYATDNYYGISLEKAYAFLKEKGIKPGR